MTIKELMQQDPREFFGLDDPRDIQQVLADDDAEREPPQRTSDAYEQSESNRQRLGAGWQH